MSVLTGGLAGESRCWQGTSLLIYKYEASDVYRKVRRRPATTPDATTPVPSRGSATDLPSTTTLASHAQSECSVWSPPVPLARAVHHLARRFAASTVCDPEWGNARWRNTSAQMAGGRNPLARVRRTSNA